MADSPSYDVDPGTPTSFHRSRPSVVTQASALAESTISYGSIMSRDGLARLSQFPTPPNGFPIFGDDYVPSSPTSDTTITPPMSPRRALPVPPVPPVPPLPPLNGTAPLNLRRRLPDPVEPISPSTPRQPSEPLGTALPPQISGASTKSSRPSPHDWHDGSSSIATDPYGESVLSTSFITSLLSSVTESSGDSGNSAQDPPKYKKNLYDPSILSNGESTITYPPPRTFSTLPPYTHTPPPPAPIHEPIPSVHVASTQRTQDPTRNFALIGGRSTPETLRSMDTGGPKSSLDTSAHESSSALGALSMSPSMHSMNSTTPLIQSFPREEPIVEEEEPKSSSGPSTPGRSREHRRLSVAHSNKTTKSYVSSLIARVSHSSGAERRSLKRASAALFRKKPLPPVPPLPDIPIQDIRQHEDNLQLPDLVDRARALSHLLDKGHRPHHSMSSAKDESHGNGSSPSRSGMEGEVIYRAGDPRFVQTSKDTNGRFPWEGQNQSQASGSGRWRWSSLSRKRRLSLWLVLVVIVAAIIVGVAVGVTAGKKNAKHHCLGDLAGATCSLNATCVCTSITGGQCNNLAQVLVDLVPKMNNLFNTTFTPPSLSTALFETQGAQSGPNCATQANLIDVSPALDASIAPNRTTWAQAALLWNLALSQDLDATSQLQDFVRKVDWSSLGPSDGPVADSGSKFSTQVSGFVFDFAQQTVTVPPTTFRDAGQAPQGQLSKVNGVAEAALDRVYTYAVASSTQQTDALSHFWVSVLHQKTSDLSSFISGVRGAAVLLPFDSTLSLNSSNSMSNLLTNSTTTPFPPALACYPQLSSSQLQVLNSIETSVFGLPTASAASSFDTSCYPNRPIYGVLDILQLRLPFMERTGVAQQAAVLSADASSRVIVYSGETLSAFPGAPANTSQTLVTDPRQYGTLNNLNHVLFSYLSSIPDRNVATELVEYILSAKLSPPSNTSALFTAIPTLPALEVAVFGTVSPADIDHTVSSLSDSSGELYFGTTASSNLRDWSLNAVNGGEVVWTELATSPQIVRDTSFTNINFNLVWNPAFNFFHEPNNLTVTVSNITESFSHVKLFGP